MRAKRTRVARRGTGTRRTNASVPTDEWIVETELGWGVPHPLVALIGLLALAMRTSAATVRGWLAHQPR